MRSSIIVMLLAASAVSHADHPRYSRRAAVPDAPAHQAAPPAPVKAEPTVTATQLMQIEDGNQPIRQEQAAILEQLVRDTPDSDPEKPDIMFRLAEHYARELRYWRIKAGDAELDQLRRAPRSRRPKPHAAP